MRLIKTMMAGVSLCGVLSGLAAPAVAATPPANQRIEVAFVLDTTGSMGDLIDGAKRKIWSIANTIVDINPDADIRMALIGYRDRGDDYVITTHDMSADIQGLYGNLVQFEANGGGDTPESVNEALDTAVRKLQWSKEGDSRRIIFLVGDAPPHMDYDNAPQYPEVVKTAAERDIVINAVQAGDDPDTRTIWKDIAQRANGRYIPIPQDGGTVIVIETPYDDEIIELQQRIDRTVVPYGNREKQQDLVSKMETKAAAPASVQVENSEFYSKRSVLKEVVTGGGDLIADIRNGTNSLDKIAEDELPEDFKTKTVEERTAILTERSAERSRLEAEMTGLVAKRGSYIAEKDKETSATASKDSFDEVVAKTLQTQLR